MQLIELKLDGKLLHYRRGSRQFFKVVANNDDYCVKVEFSDPRPNAVAVIFEMFGTPYTVLLDENNVAEVPDGVLIGGKKLRVGLSWGEDLDVANLTGTMTSTAQEILVEYSIRSRLREQLLPAPSNSDFLTQLTALVNGIKNVASVAIDNNGHLILTLTNGTTQDAGPVNDWNTLQNRPFGDLEIIPDPIEMPESTDGLSSFTYQAFVNHKTVTAKMYRVSDVELSKNNIDGATLYYSINGTESSLTIDKTQMGAQGPNGTDDMDSVWTGAFDHQFSQYLTYHWPGYRLLMLVNRSNQVNQQVFADVDGGLTRTPSSGVWFASYSSNDEVVRVTRLVLTPRVTTVQIPDRYIPSTAKVSTAQAAAAEATSAKNAAQTAKNQAQTAKNQAESAKAAAQTAQTAAEAAQAAAEAARDASGKSAYQLAVEAGYAGTEEQWLASLKGPKGDNYELTNADKETIAALVLNELPTAEGVSYP